MKGITTFCAAVVALSGCHQQTAVAVEGSPSVVPETAGAVAAPEPSGPNAGFAGSGTIADSDQDSQNGAPSGHKVASPPPTDPTPVTDSEGRDVFARMQSLFRAVLPHTGEGAVTVPDDGKPLLRQQALRELARLYAFAEPSFKVTPPPVQIVTGVVKMQGADRDAAFKLIKAGALANYGRIVTGPADTLTTQELGDAVGFFLARIAQMSHMPSSKFTPELQGPPGIVVPYKSRLGQTGH